MNLFRALLDRLTRGVRGTLGGRATPVDVPLTPGRFGGKSILGPTHDYPLLREFPYGHTVRGGVPQFSIPGPGGGTVPIPALAAEAQAGGRGSAAWEAIGRQSESAARMAAIDELLREMEAQMQASGGPFA